MTKRKDIDLTEQAESHERIPAEIAAEFANRFLMHRHRGVINCDSYYVIFGNDGYSTDLRSRKESKNVMRRFRGHDYQFGLSGDGHTWAIVLTDLTQSLYQEEELDHIVWDVWMEVCDEISKLKDTGRWLVPYRGCSSVRPDQSEIEHKPARNQNMRTTEMTKAEFDEDTSVYDEGFLQGLGELEERGGEPAPKSRRAARTKRVHIRDMVIERDENDSRLASNGGFFKISITPSDGEMQNSFRVVPSDDRSGTADDLRSLRNLIVDLEGTELPAKQTRSRLSFWKWKAEVTLRILEHPAMAADGNPGMYPDFDCLGWEEDFFSGMTVEDEYQKVDALFNQYGW